MIETNPEVIKKKQQRNLWVALIAVLMVLFGLYFLVAEHHVATETKDKGETISLDTPLNHVDAQYVWIERAQNELAQETKKNEALKQQIELLQQSKETQDKSSEQQSLSLQILQQQVVRLQKQFNEQKRNINFNENRSDIRDATLHLTPLKSNKNVSSKNTDTFVPAGTFVRAIAIGGADASAGVTSQGNPTPMLFHILDQGTLPNSKKGHLKNCVATAAAIGDISSERGAVRLERLSCVKPSGEVVEIAVEATVFGPDGKDGIRGTPLWREGALLQRAFYAGALSGVSSGISSSYTTATLSPLGATSEMVSKGAIVPYGLARGLGNAADKFAEYNIKRAEQYHPVIQLSAGTVVDIVFLKGFYLDGRKEGEGTDYLAPATVPSDTDNDTSETGLSDETSTDNHVPSSLPLTPQQIKTLQQKNAEQKDF